MWLQNQNRPFEFTAPGILEMLQESLVPKPQTKHIFAVASEGKFGDQHPCITLSKRHGPSRLN